MAKNHKEDKILYLYIYIYSHLDYHSVDQIGVHINKDIENR